MLSEGTRIVSFSTEAHVEIIRPANRIAGAEGTRHAMNLTTEFHNSTAKACCSLLQRKMKKELTALKKKNEMAVDVNKGEITNTSQ